MMFKWFWFSRFFVVSLKNTNVFETEYFIKGIENSVAVLYGVIEHLGIFRELEKRGEARFLVL